MAPVDSQTVLGRNMTGPVGDPLTVAQEATTGTHSSIDHTDLAAILGSNCYVLVPLLNMLLILCILILVILRDGSQIRKLRHFKDHKITQKVGRLRLNSNKLD